MKKFIPILLILGFTIIFYLPILRSPNILVNRGNDLTEFFFPVFYFTKNSILNFHQLPFWNNLFFSGTPLLPDPQAPIFYLPNIIFLIFKNIDTGFLISVFLHIFISGIGMYVLSLKGFKFSRITSLFCSFLYIASPKLSGYIEAGHFGLITSWAWLPFVSLLAILLSKNPNMKKTIAYALFLSLTFYTHVLIFLILVFSSSILILYLSIKNKSYKSLVFLFLAGIVCFGLIAIAFLPQLFWQSQTTRNLLLNSPDVYPKWLSKVEFMKTSISPILFGPKFIWDLDTEKTIALGLFSSIFATFGFLKLNKKNKIFLSITTFILCLVSLNNASPIYSFLVKSNFYILLRVSTRFWFILVFIIIFLAGNGFEILIKKRKLKFLIYILAIITIIEVLLTSWTKILKPIVPNTNLASSEVYEFLSKDKSQFRVFCLERCLSQKQSAIYGLQLADGYGTLQQTNYYLESEQLSQSFYRNRYTLSIPPFEIFEYETLQPYSPNLASLNVKYIISNHLLTDKNLKLIKQINNYLIYENEINLPRSNYEITSYTPNFIQINTSNYKDDFLNLSEIYNTDWRAYINGKTETKIRETPDKTREVTIDKNTKFVDFAYQPKSFIIGASITSVTIILISIYIFYEKIL